MVEECKNCSNNDCNKTQEEIDREKAILNADLSGMMKDANSRGIVLVELNHMLYNASVVLNQLHKFAVDNEVNNPEEYSKDSQTLMLLAEKYMMILKDTLDMCYTEDNNYDREINYSEIAKDEEIISYIDELEKEVLEDLGRDLEIKEL